MLGEGYTLDGAASVLGWSRALVTARAKILELPDSAQQLLGSGQLPVSSVDVLLQLAAVSAELCEAVVAAVADGQLAGSQLARDPAWALGQALRHGRGKVFAAYLDRVSGDDVAELKLGKKTETLYAEAATLHAALDRYVRRAANPVHRGRGRPGPRRRRADRVRPRHADHLRPRAVSRARQAADRPHRRAAAGEQAGP